MEKVGITSTIPIEILFAAGKIPLDLNNIFITNPERDILIRKVEERGFPKNICGWIKGIYAAALEGGFSEIVTVPQGDCSNIQALAELFRLKGIKTVFFAYPYPKDKELLRKEIKKFMAYYGVEEEEAGEWKRILDDIRGKIHRIDLLTWKENLVRGFDNHFYQVSASDMMGNFIEFEKKLDDFLEQLSFRKPLPEKIRLGFIGVPPIFDDLYPLLESFGARVVFNEVQRQFTMPYPTEDLVDQYLEYTYPYDIFGRIEDIRTEIQRRKIHGLIHYVQTFCFRQIQDLVIREKMDIPILTLEGDIPSPVDSRTRIRIEAFLEMLSETKLRD